MWFADKLLVENPFKRILIYSQNYSSKMSMLASLICSFSSSSSSLPCFSLQCLQFWKKSKTRITWQLPASRQRREQCGGCRTGRASSWGWAASAPSSAWSPGSPGAGWVGGCITFDPSLPPGACWWRRPPGRWSLQCQVSSRSPASSSWGRRWARGPGEAQGRGRRWKTAN